MENKYFAPVIEDIRMGYEYEYRVGDKFKWQEGKILNLSTDRDGWGLSELLYYLEEGNLRVAYLTAEQIEAEGWVGLPSVSPFTGKTNQWRKINGIHETGIFNEDHIYAMEYEGTTLKIQLEWQSSWNRFTGQIYEGECKCLNTFRYICKLLKINK